MMKVSDFVNTAKKIANEPTVYYSVAGGDWCKWNGSKWNMDCVCMIKGILWGFNFNKSASHGGAIYASNGVYDDNADQIINRCTNVSTNFNKIEVGELMHMPGHVGIYIGNGQVVEATAAWEYRVQISNVGADGKRSRNGISGGYWKEHGKLKYVDYSGNIPTPTPTPTKYKVGDVVNINGVYISSDSTKKLNPAITKGTITKIINGVRNPYLLDNGNIGWINDSCIVSAPQPAPSVSYYPAFKNVSIVDGLKSIGVDSSFAYRTKIANKNGISNYAGTAEQNIKLLDLARQGKLIKI